MFLLAGSIVTQSRVVGFRFIIFAFVLIFSIASASLCLAEDWYVIPDSIHPSTSPSTKAQDQGVTLHYKQLISEKAVVPGKDLGKDAGVSWVEFDYKGRALYLPEALAVKKVENKGNLPIGKEKVDHETPLPIDYNPTDLVNLNAKWSYQAGGKNRLRREAASAAEAMFAAAKKDGIELRIASSYRPALQQRTVYLGKIKQDGLLQNSVAKPGHSEHALGTTMDLATVAPKTVLNESFGDTPEGKWLKANAPRFGFRLSYTKENAAQTKYIPEPWHVRFVGK